MITMLYAPRGVETVHDSAGQVPRGIVCEMHRALYMSYIRNHHYYYYTMALEINCFSKMTSLR